jgi:hypothetical protein
MPAGLPYFAWVDASETTFGSEHMRWDEAVFSFELKQDEGDPASLTAVVRRPQNTAGDAIGLLGPGRKIWAWFALDCGPALIKFRGRLVGIPTSIFEELVTLEFVAKPVDVVVQKAALADTLRVLPYYDEAVIDKDKRDDPDVVLEGYTKIWHYDRESHVITVSDEITGEDGLVEFDGASETGKVLYDGLGLTLTTGPLARVDVIAEYTWTQQGRGTVDLTQWIMQSWNAIDPFPTGYVSGGAAIKLKAGDWPKYKTGLGDGWEVASSTADDLFAKSSGSVTGGSTNIVSYQGEQAHTTTYTETNSSSSDGGIGVGPGGPGTYQEDIKVTYSTDGDGSRYQSSFSRNFSSNQTGIALQAIRPTLVAGYTAERKCTERVAFSLFADVQSILTDPEDGEALRIDDVRSVNLSESIDGGELPIGDPRRRSYIATERGNRSVEYLIVLARAHLMKRARVVEIAFAPKLSRMPEITLRKNGFLIEPRVGEALGKIIGYSVGLDGSDGRIQCEVRIGCTIGRGGSAVASGGEPTYASIDYVGADYQQFTGRTLLLGPSVGYEPPAADPNDDGLDLLSALSSSDVIEVPLSLEFGPEHEGPPLPVWSGVISADNQDTADEFFQKAREQYQVRAKFKLKSMTRDFSTDYEIQVTDLYIPTGIDLEAV